MKEDERKIIAICVGGGKNGVEEMVRKLHTHGRLRQRRQARGRTEVDEMTKTGEKPGRRIED